MRRNDRLFTLGTVVLTLVVPGLLVLTRPLDESDQAAGFLSGWGAALLIMVPSYLLLMRGLRSGDFNRVLRAQLGGTLGRLVAMVACIVLFSRLMPEPPMLSFLIAFGLGWFALTTLELYAALGGETA